MVKVWKTFKKWTKTEVKMKETPSKKLYEKKDDFWSESPGIPREKSAQQTPPNQQDTYTQPTKSHTHPSKVPSKGDFKGWLQKVSEEGEWRRVTSKGECRKGESNGLTRLGRLQARSGYIWTTSPPGFLGYPAGNCALEYPDSWPSHPLNFRAPTPDFQIHFSSFWVLFSALFDFRLLSDLIFQLPSSIFFLFWELVGSILAQIFMKLMILS